MPAQARPPEINSRYGHLVAWTLLACVIAGSYGAVHNQISFTISPDYFLAFKFLQFQIPTSLENRWGAAWVGWQASWWTGLAIGPALVMTNKRFRKRCPRPSEIIRGMTITLLTAASFGIAAFALGQTITEVPTSAWIPGTVKHELAFHRAGILHDASYLGAAIGLLLACLLTARQPTSPLVANSDNR